MRRASAAFALFAILAASSASASDFDGGGDVLQYMNNVHLANARGQSVRLDGVCLSACTMKLGLHRACVTPEARFGFHSPTRADGRMAAAWRAVLLQHYPARIRSHVAPMLEQRDYTFVSGRTLIALGMKPCNEAGQMASQPQRPYRTPAPAQAASPVEPFMATFRDA